MMTTVHIRAMTPADLDFAAACTAAEGWRSETRDEFEGFYEHAPEGCLVAERGHRRVGICVATPYGAYGFVGELIVASEARRHGVGRRLLESAIAYLHGLGVGTIYLDGVLAAVPLYERLGFRRVCRSLRFSGTLHGRAHPHVRPMVEVDLDAVRALDRSAFGVDRGFFLERRLAQSPVLCKVLEQDGKIVGYVLGRRTEDLVSVGPWVVHPEVERPVDLLESLAVETGDCTLGLGILESNTAAVAAVRALGFAERADPPWRMALGPSNALGASPMAYAVGSPAKG
jgi:ribosomal protein S18 acetylase RimI-like enzyme